ncbi:MAG: DUF4335 domain-containing protein [Synechococcales cyanobacterium M58_A2018_015]|nr:DUF4335 domain-containing protein [Synechococcales cyanobacterium M58_A2018_015]
MTIQRQYSLPNCRLILEGLSNETLADPIGRPPLSIVTNVECHLAGQSKPLTGGRDFLTSLTTAVSEYAQEYLSGIHHLIIRRDRSGHTPLVELQRLDSHLHRLIIHPEPGQSNSNQPAQHIDLTTVQLFDLVEAVDQLYADGQTLPDLSLKLTPLSKRYIRSQEPIGKRAVPALVGASSLAAAAALLFMVPVPEVRRPETASETTATESPVAAPTVSPSPAAPPPDASASPVAPSPIASPSPDANASGAGVNLVGAPEITDQAELDRLTVQLYDQLDLAWDKVPTFDQPLEYRVGVDTNGEIVGYKFANDQALTYLNDTPLAEIQFDAVSPEEGGTSSPLAQFLVVFKPDGVLEVSPWYGQSTESEESKESGSGAGTVTNPELP